jgi:hypothetical protein
MKHQLRSLKNGRIYRLSAREIAAFFAEHISGRLAQGVPPVSGIRVIGSVLLQLFNPDAELLQVHAGVNLVVDTGKAAVIDRLQGTSVGVHDFQAIGTGTNAAAAGDTTLQTEIGTRVQGTLSQPNATTDRLVSTFAAANGTGAITETGRLTASSGGNLFARQVFSVINKGASDSLQVTHDITVS